MAITSDKVINGIARVFPVPPIGCQILARRLPDVFPTGDREGIMRYGNTIKTTLIDLGSTTNNMGETSTAPPFTIVCLISVYRLVMTHGDATRENTVDIRDKTRALSDAQRASVDPEIAGFKECYNALLRVEAMVDEAERTNVRILQMRIIQILEPFGITLEQIEI